MFIDMTYMLEVQDFIFFLHIQFFIPAIIKKNIVSYHKRRKKIMSHMKEKKKLFFPYIGIAFHPGIIGIYAWKRLFMYTSTSCFFCFAINFVYEHWKCHSLNSPFDCDDETTNNTKFIRRLVESHTIVILSFLYIQENKIIIFIKYLSLNIFSHI